MTEGILNKPRDIRRSGHPLEPWRRTPPESMSGGRPDASVGLENILGIDFGQCLLSLIVLYIGLIIGKVLATVEIDTYYLNEVLFRWDPGKYEAYIGLHMGSARVEIIAIHVFA